MVVEDTAQVLRLLTNMLGALGYRVSAWPDGEQALQAAARTPPDLFLLDINLPGLSGLEVCEKLKADERLGSLPVIFLSADDDTTEKVRALRAGGVDYITKPFHIEEVAARVQTHLQLRQFQRTLEEQNTQLERVVADRTRDLAQAYERLQSLDRLKRDFLDMISHEMRTPSNNIMGITPLLFGLCPASTERDELFGLYQQSSSRLLRLLDDADLLNSLEMPVRQSEAPAFTLRDILREATALTPHIETTARLTEACAATPIQGEPTLLIRALMIAIRLAGCFRTRATQVTVVGRAEAEHTHLEFASDNLSLSPAGIAHFFELTSVARSSSAAESLGLAPVLAHRILSLFGGAIRLVSDGDRQGHLLITLARQNADPATPGQRQAELPFS